MSDPLVANNRKCASAFGTWWMAEGRRCAQLTGAKSINGIRYLCRVAWMNGAYKATEYAGGFK